MNPDEHERMERLLNQIRAAVIALVVFAVLGLLGALATRSRDLSILEANQQANGDRIIRVAEKLDRLFQRIEALDGRLRTALQRMGEIPP